jgi:hypothetical protein
MLDVSKDHDDGNQFIVFKAIKMFSTTTLMTRTNVLMLKPWVVNERLDLQCNEVKLQILLPWPFMLMDITLGPIGASTFGVVSITLKMPFSSTFGTKTPSFKVNLNYSYIMCKYHKLGS